MRLFLALVPPPDIRSQLLSAMGGIPGARWQDDDQLHLTIRFIGEADRHFCAALTASLAQERLGAIEARMEGLGHFSKRGRAGQLWAGVRPAEPIAALHRKCDRLCVALGAEPDHRLFVPHVTLARFGRAEPVPEARLAPFLAEYGGLVSPSFRFDELVLFESHVTHHGGRYRVLESFAMADRGG